MDWQGVWPAQHNTGTLLNTCVAENAMLPTCAVASTDAHPAVDPAGTRMDALVLHMCNCQLLLPLGGCWVHASVYQEFCLVLG